MIQQFIVNGGAKTLRVFFAGWGSDDNLFGGYVPQCADYLLCYDYRSLSFDYSLFEGYERVEVVAWSFGVWVAGVVLGTEEARGLNIVRSVAINGTLSPIDERRGIPPSIFEGTLSGFSPSGLVKFRRRMCGGSEGVKEFLALSPRRPLEELREELEALGTAVQSESERSKFQFLEVVISSADNIIPTANQMQAWREHKNVRVVEGYHFSTAIFDEYLRGVY